MSLTAKELLNSKLKVISDIAESVIDNSPNTSPGEDSCLFVIMEVVNDIFKELNNGPSVLDWFLAEIKGTKKDDDVDELYYNSNVRRMEITRMLLLKKRHHTDYRLFFDKTAGVLKLEKREGEGCDSCGEEVKANSSDDKTIH